MFNPHTHLPLLFQGDWNGSGAHTNFSTEAMRGDGGMEAIEAAIEKMSTKHMEHIKVYDPNEGADNKKRLIGSHETAAFDKFSWGVADRKASVRCKIFFSQCSALPQRVLLFSLIRVPRQVAEDGKGYLEDRRPASNCDPYLVTGKLVETCCL